MYDLYTQGKGEVDPYRQRMGTNYEQDTREKLVKEGVENSFDKAIENLRDDIHAASEKICMQFVNNIRDLIKSTSWRVGKIGGENILIDGRKVKVPKNVAKIFEQCQKAREDKR